MSDYKKVEEMLKNYKKTQAEISNIQLEIDEIKSNYVGISAISYEERTGATNKFNSNVENEVIHRIENIDVQIETLEKMKLSKSIEIQKIDNAIGSLLERQAKIIEMKYFSGLSNKEIARQLDLTEQTICDIKSKAINSMVNLILIKY
ncbi:MAG: sigma-70 family RNA polymerase sigma factor [Bacillota bacterium]|nr:sigma-70 family RNA polymerase sigma factor [Bacillota bacterium]